jgi:hypothetical protein
MDSLRLEHPPTSVSASPIAESQKESHDGPICASRRVHRGVATCGSSERYTASTLALKMILFTTYSVSNAFRLLHDCGSNTTLLTVITSLRTPFSVINFQTCLLRQTRLGGLHFDASLYTRNLIIRTMSAYSLYYSAGSGQVCIHLRPSLWSSQGSNSRMSVSKYHLWRAVIPNKAQMYTG